MKTKITLLALITLFATKKATSQIQVNEGDKEYFSTWIDPTFTDKGEQIGITYTMVSNWMFAEYSVSHYSTLKPSYTDLVVTWGGAFKWGKLDFYTGVRIGLIYRETWQDNEDKTRFGLYGLGGVMTRFQYPVYEDKLYIGVQFHLDARMDLSNDFVRQNSSFYITYKLKR